MNVEIVYMHFMTEIMVPKQTKDGHGIPPHEAFWQSAVFFKQMVHSRPLFV